MDPAEVETNLLGTAILIVAFCCRYWYTGDFFRSLYSYNMPTTCQQERQNIFRNTFPAVNLYNCLSPVPFIIFVNLFVVTLRAVDVDCHFSSKLTACLLYTDNIILIFPSLIGLQLMLSSCDEC